ncbi:uncharacterized protein LOC115673296 isoform X2 [Syzygium oleosum]|uniref:uncharacterized protein LOC115673296 isoform X2 n=1 Tax=Syzygium oleosum TaxID=219896 RepID=UPI0024B8AA18|nr:uncharacterized protein LOC115673296 isoform X2 [Syzygium oleosum]
MVSFMMYVIMCSCFLRYLSNLPTCRYKRGGHMHGAVSQRRAAPSPSPFPSLSSSPAISCFPQLLHANGQHGHIGPSSDPQEHIRGQFGNMRTESTPVPCPSVPPSSSVQHLNDEGNTGEEDSRFIICPYGDSFTDATYVVRQLNKIVNNSWRGQYISYSSAPKEVKGLWWNEFKVNELGTEPTYTVTFERTFQKKDKTWIVD